MNLFTGIDTYIRSLLGREDDHLRAIRESMAKEGVPAINVSANQGKFIQVLARGCQARHILEIGTLAGYSTLWLARALPEEGRIISLEMDPRYAAIARQHLTDAGLKGKAEVRVGKALDLLPALAAEGLSPFDFIFIDGDKPPYLEYFDWAVRLARPGSIIVADNVVREGRVLDPDSPDEKVQGVQRLNKALATDPRVTATILQTVGEKEHDGMVIAVVNDAHDR